MSRHDRRAANDLRSVEIETDFQNGPMASVLMRMGGTHVICAASVEDRVPGFLYGSGEGWVTAEYSMLPSATGSRSMREVVRGRPSGRTMEIQRLIGRSMRAVVDRTRLGERTIWIDCDVIQADGGTRTASITGGFVAMAMALSRLRERGDLRAGPVLTGAVAAVSVGVVDGEPALDLDYVEDSAADVDLNVVRTDGGEYVEVQGTAEGKAFDRSRLDALLDLADGGVEELLKRQRAAIGSDALDQLGG